MAFLIKNSTLDLGTTSYENIFITELMPQAPEVALKVYLLGYKLALDNSELSNSQLAKSLSTSLDSVKGAWDYWEKRGVILKQPRSNNDYDVVFLSLRELYLGSGYNSSTSISQTQNYSLPKETVDSLLLKDDIQAMLQGINQLCRRQLTYVEHTLILETKLKLTLDNDIIIAAFEYSIDKKGKNNVRYVMAILKNWHNEGIITYQKLLESFDQRDELSGMLARVKRAMGLSVLYEVQRDTIKKWIGDYGYSIDIILFALGMANQTSNPNISYFDKIITTWHQKGLKTLEDIKSSIGNEDTLSKAPQKTKASKFHNFPQREGMSDQELEEHLLKRGDKN